MADTGFTRRWLLLVGAFLPFVALWSLSNPLFGSPDETTHMVRAQSIAVGRFSSPFVTDGLPIRSVECFAFQAEVPASCQDLTWDPDGTEYELPTENYPPFFHAVAAAPAIFTSGIWGAYFMRLWLAALWVVLLGWAGALLTRPGDSPWLLTGLCLAVPPMGVFTMATVNPSGPAVASSALLVAGLLNLHTSHRRSKEVTTAIGVGAALLVLMRRDGVIWLGAIGLAYAPLGIRSIPREGQRRPTRGRVALAVVTVALVAYMTIAFAGPTLASFLHGRSNAGGTNPWEAARYIRMYLTQLIGTFGWLDSPIGEEAFLVAMIIAGFVIVLGLVAHERAMAESTLVALAMLLLAPVIFGVVKFPYLQGRYLLPMWVALLLIGATSSATARLPVDLTRHLTRLLLGGWLAVHIVGFVQNIRRYAVGRTGPWRSILSADWHPPMMSLPVAFALLALCAAVAILGVDHVLKSLERGTEATRLSSIADRDRDETARNFSEGSPTDFDADAHRLRDQRST